MRSAAASSCSPVTAQGRWPWVRKALFVRARSLTRGWTETPAGHSLPTDTTTITSHVLPPTHPYFMSYLIPLDSTKSSPVYGVSFLPSTPFILLSSCRSVFSLSSCSCHTCHCKEHVVGKAVTRSIRFMHAYVQYFTLPIVYCVHTLYFLQATCVLYIHTLHNSGSPFAALCQACAERQWVRVVPHGSLPGTV